MRLSMKDREDFNKWAKSYFREKREASAEEVYKKN